MNLKWSDIAWDAKRITIQSPKTEHHEGRDTRVIPLFTQIETELRKLLCEQQLREAEVASDAIFPEINENTNLRTTLEKIIRRAGVTQWPKLWQNLRASGSTDLARTLPGHVASAICGHTEQIAKEHYWQVAGSDLDEAIKSMDPKSVPIFVPNDCQSESSQGDKSSESVHTETPETTQKQPENADFGSSSHAQLASACQVSVAGAGLEKQRQTIGI